MFKVGDKVKVINQESFYYGCEGVVTALGDGFSRVSFGTVDYYYSNTLLERMDDMDISERISEVIKENQKLKQQLSDQNIKLNKIQADARREQCVSDEEFGEAYEFYSGSNKNIHATVWGNLYLENIFSNLSLSEFVSKYKEYKDKQNEIGLGDEIRCNKAGERFKGAVLQIFNDGEGYKVLCENGCGQIVYPSEIIEKTGRHFDEVETLLDSLRGI